MQLRKLVAIGSIAAGIVAFSSFVAPMANADSPCTVTPSQVFYQAGLGCLYVNTPEANDLTIEVVAESDPPGDAGYVGVSNKDRDNQGGIDTECNNAHGTTPGGQANNTNGGGCYYVDGLAPGTPGDTDNDGDIEVDLRDPALAAVPMPVSGDTSGDYNNTDREGSGGTANCDVQDTVDDLVFGNGAGLFGEC